MLGFDDANFASPEDKLCKWDGVIDVLVFVPGRNGGCTKAPVDEAVNDPDGVLITSTSGVIVVSSVE